MGFGFIYIYLFSAKMVAATYSLLRTSLTYTCVCSGSRDNK